MAKIVITFTDSRSVADVKQVDFPVDSGSPHKVITRLARYAGALATKKPRASADIQVQNGDGVQGSCTVTPASAQAADTVTVAGITVTASSSTTDATHFKVGVSDTADAAALATCINTNTTLKKFLTASADSGVCTIEATTPGAHALGYNASSSNGTRLAVSASPFQDAASDTATTTTYHYGA